MVKLIFPQKTFNNMIELKSNLSKLLLKEALSENELARRTGIAQQIINRILSGENRNPKLATLSPIAKYFNISISQLIGESELENNSLPPLQLSNLREIPIIDFNLLETYPLLELIHQSNETIISDKTINEKQLFAIKLIENLIEPKCPSGSLLIFDMKKKPIHGDFVLLKIPHHPIGIRQYFIKEERCYINDFNSARQDFQTMTLNEHHCLGVLIQSRVSYNP